MIRIVIIEDEKVIRQNLQQMLELHGYRIYAEATGEAGLKTINEILPDLVLCDVRLPGIDGTEVLVRIRNTDATRDIPFIILSAKVDREDIRIGMNIGADDYITKPYNMQDVIKSISARLARKGHYSAVQSLVSKNPEFQIQWSMLSPTQRKVLTIVANGCNTREVAEKLFISVKTAENHRCAISSKLGLFGHNAVLNYALANKEEILNISQS